MGKILQIQVRAWTYDESEVTKTWPRLANLVWPNHDQWSPVGSKHGVMDLVQAMPDVLEFGTWAENVKMALKPGIQKSGAICKQLEEALANWQPVEANRLSDCLEDQLTTLEQAIPTDD